MQYLFRFVFVCVVLLLFWGESTVFATGSVTQSPSMTVGIMHFFHLMISMCSRIWVVLAAVAGKLLTNEVVYGEFINLDAALFQLWIIVRTFTNYLLGFFILYKILRYIFSDPNTNDTGSIMKSIGAVVLGGVGIQFSWFLLGAIIDLSTILSVAVGALPTLIITNDGPTQQFMAQQTIQIPKKITIKLDQTLDKPLNEAVSKTTEEVAKMMSGENMQSIGLTEFIDRVMPNSSNVGGPLIYIGLSVIHAQNYLAWTPDMSTNDVSDMFVTVMIKAGVLLAYTVALFLMVIANFLRVLYIWMIVIASPVIILMIAVKLSQLDVNLGQDYDKWFKIEDILKGIFMPVVFIAYISLMLVGVVTMQRMMVQNEDYAFNNGKVFVENNRIGFGDTTFTLEGELWPNAGEDTKSTITDLILMIFTLMLMYGLVYLASSTGPTFISGIVGRARNFATGALSNIPIGGNMTLGSAANLPSQFIAENGRAIGRREDGNKDVGRKFMDNIFNPGKNSFSLVEEGDISRVLTNSRATTSEITQALGQIASGAQKEGAKNLGSNPRITKLVDTLFTNQLGLKTLIVGGGFARKADLEAALRNPEYIASPTFATYIDALKDTSLKTSFLEAYFQKIMGKKPTKRLTSLKDFYADALSFSDYTQASS